MTIRESSPRRAESLVAVITCDVFSDRNIHAWMELLEGSDRGHVRCRLVESKRLRVLSLPMRVGMPLIARNICSGSSSNNVCSMTRTMELVMRDTAQRFAFDQANVTCVWSHRTLSRWNASNMVW